MSIGKYNSQNILSSTSESTSFRRNQDFWILRQIILDNNYCRFPLLLLRFWIYLFRSLPEIRTFLTNAQRKPIKRVLREVWASWHRWGMFPFDYFSCMLYSKKSDIDIHEIIEYVPQFYFDHVYIPSRNDRLYSLNLQSKILMDKLLACRAIPRPRTMFTIESGKIWSNEGVPLDFEAFSAALLSIDITISKLFAKPALGRGGHNIHVFIRDTHGYFRTSSGNALDAHYFEMLGKTEDFIIQAGLEQIETLNQIYPHAVNTIRIPSIVENGIVRPIAAILRIGRDKKHVDNSAQGGISVELNIDSWSMLGIGYSEHPVGSHARHPDTNASFNHPLPMKIEVLELLNEAAAAIPKCNVLGWDVALTPIGPVIVEVNPGFGLNHIQISCQRGIKRDLGICL